MKNAIGYFRDLVAAVLGLLILFGVDLTDAQLAGVLLVVSTGGAFGAYVWAAYRQRHAADASPKAVDAPPVYPIGA